MTDNNATNAPEPELPKVPEHFFIYMAMWDKARNKQTAPTPYPLAIRTGMDGKPYVHWKNRRERRMEASLKRKLGKLGISVGTLK